MSIRILLTNDDGPPRPHESPFVLGFYRYLTRNLGWSVKVVLPNAQKSWIGKAHHIHQTTKGWYFYPRDDGQGEIVVQSRPLKDGELAEWILLDGTPATCANIALHNLYPGQIDLVISGPNVGRNTSAAFALSSGTIGAALSSSFNIRSIALSYGIVKYPTPTEYLEPANVLSCNIIQRLWDNWGKDDGSIRDGEVDLYSVNIPLVEGLLSDSGLKIRWTSLWRNGYGPLYKHISGAGTLDQKQFMTAGPDALVIDGSSPPARGSRSSEVGDLLFTFSPDLSEILSPTLSIPPVGSDAWAIHHGWVSVTPLRACFAEPSIKANDEIWKIKL
ncbi:hypothetical protein APHAL10511_006360 [Amanita phalloides]|nr:hypothetical protein APHAL10511_006360 [Amanita phalloides]